ncbi:MAG: endonuclease [Bacteroidales bacterium]
MQAEKGGTMLILILSILLNLNPLCDINRQYEPSPKLRIGFYNLENLFDYFDDSLKKDDDFTPLGIKAWGKKKYENKCVQLFKVIAALGAEVPLTLLGVCEVENAKVLRDLCFGTPLRQNHFNFIHYESQDARGIDVALLYRSDYFSPSLSYPIPIIYPSDTVSFTRDILYVKGYVFQKDSLHIFVNHFPSKYGGATATIGKRAFVAKVLKNAILKIYAQNPKANILVMGDFNDEPSDPSITQVLGASCQSVDTQTFLFNLMCPFQGKEGSNKFRQEWSIIDQIMLSPNLYFNSNKEETHIQQAHIFAPSFMLMKDEIYMGIKLFRTYNGMKYLGGFSDHLPVYWDW